tara:strand:+ start:58 stop:804 length:747 start_codon:yes stop_codon:yes gene_type:complete
MVDLQKLASTFSRDGFVLLDQLWTADETTKIESELDRFIVDCVPGMAKTDKWFTNGLEGEIKNLGFLNRYDPYFEELSKHSLMQEIATALLGSKAIFTGHEYFSRPPHSDAIGPYHQDNGYFFYDPPEALAFWIPLDDVNEDNGGVAYAKGSHNAGTLPHEASGIRGFSQQIVDAENQLKGFPEVFGVLPRGGCAIHHCLTAHRSGSNITDRKRRAMVANYKTTSAKESPFLHDKLKRYLDELKKDSS